MDFIIAIRTAWCELHYSGRKPKVMCVIRDSIYLVVLGSARYSWFDYDTARIANEP